MASLIGGGIGSMPAVGLLRNMVRLLVRAADEYEAAISLHKQAVKDGSPIGLILVSTHWEGCIEALHRCMLIAETFRTQLGRWAPEDHNLRINKAARFTVDEQTPIREIRHAVQHIDQELGRYVKPEGSTDRGDGIFIACDADGIRFHAYSVTYAEMADYIKRLAELSHWLNMQELSVGHPLADPERKAEVKFEGSEAYRRPFG